MPPMTWRPGAPQALEAAVPPMRNKLRGGLPAGIEPLDAVENPPKEAPCQVALGRLEHEVPSVPAATWRITIWHIRYGLISAGGWGKSATHESPTSRRWP